MSDHAATLQAVATFREDAVRYAYARLEDWNDADDVVQNAMLAIVRRIDDFDFAKHPRRLLIGFVRRQVLYLLTKRDRSRMVHGEFTLANATRYEREDLDREIALEGVRKNVQRLPRHLFTLAVGRYWGGRQLKDIGRDRGVSHQAMSQRLKRVHSSLRHSLRAG